MFAVECLLGLDILMSPLFSNDIRASPLALITCFLVEDPSNKLKISTLNIVLKIFVIIFLLLFRY